ncbi:MAG: serine/threonine protein phosphatase [Gluconacetobacter diazotrophicus]|nr:serine/threonine protein phosphatase [Gluconacetobacter diazotrophicus]
MMFEFQPAPASLPRGRRIYAVGDVHGCLGALRALHAVVAADLERRPVERPLLLHVGDYVDRGPDSAGVIEQLSDPTASPVAEVVNLLGNHEDMLLRGLAGDADMAETWLDNGGDDTLRSWGIVAPSGGDPAAWGAEWEAAIPERHLRFLRGLRLGVAEGGYWFSHAGVRPDRSLAKQQPHDLVWIREPFLSWRGRLEKVVVHGHTPREVAEVRPHRIGIDTGAVYGGRLTCAVLEDDRVGFVSVPGEA